MEQDKIFGHVVEPEKRVPIAHDVDVAVVGAGLSGLYSAIAAGRQGVKTLLIDRFAILGGNLGPAMIVAGSVYGEAGVTLPGGLAGIPKELVTQMEELRGSPNSDYADQSNIISYLGTKMCEDAGVELLLGVWASDPIIEGSRMTGLFVEGKSGRAAVRARVVIDGSADADVARRAGVPIITDFAADPAHALLIGPNYLRPEYEVWNDTAILYVMADVDFDRYKAFCDNPVTLSEADRAWLENADQFPWREPDFPDPLVPLFRQAWESGEYRFQKTVEPTVHITIPNIAPGDPSVSRLLSTRVNMGGTIRRDDTKQHSRLEAAIRVHVFETVQFFRRYVPGFEKTYLLFMAPYLGSRGGPHIDGEYTITPQDAFTGKKFDDVLYVNTHAAQPHSGGELSGFDTPYRSLLPKGLDGLLVTGRASAYLRRGHDPGATRARPALQQMGEAAGVAAAIAVQDGVTPRHIDIKKLQRHLLSQGFYLGDDKRLTALGLQ
ncbi:MAG: hypothetical protein CL878_01100 [Dehalococcoidia bacterium]|nr:hypothetical protein [Dehalococcoidia bacterium]